MIFRTAFLSLAVIGLTDSLGQLQDSAFDIASLEAELFPIFSSGIPRFTGSSPHSRLMAQAGLPLGEFFGLEQFLALRGSYSNRSLYFDGFKLNAAMNHQIGLGAGSMIMDAGGHSSYALLAVSHNGDDYEMKSRYMGWEAIYVHTYRIHDRLSLGAGFDIILNFMLCGRERIRFIGRLGPNPECNGGLGKACTYGSSTNGSPGEKKA